MTKYVKLIAKPDTWFKAGTEAFDYDEYGKRITLESYNKWLKSGSILARGIHIYEDGVEAEDGELCGIDEFDAELVEEERLIQTNQVDVMIEMAKDSDKLESENFIEKVNNIPWPKPLDPPTTTAEAEARQRRFEDNIRYIQG
jgi:hypothetical protein